MYIVDDFTNRDFTLDEIEEDLHNTSKDKIRFITDLYFQLVELEKSQYVEITDEKYIDELKNSVYKDVKNIAFISHGKSEIEFDEKNSLCYIILYSDYLFFNEDIAISPTVLSSIMKIAAWTKISTTDNYVKIQFMFNTKKRVKTADFSNKIDNLKEQIKTYSKI